MNKVLVYVKQFVSDLLDSDADSHRVDGALDEDLLLLVATDHHRLKQKLLTTPVKMKN